MTFRALEVECVPVQTPQEIAAVVTLALQIWPEFYIPIIGAAQVDYMLRNLQSHEAIAAQISAGCQYFLVKPKLSAAEHTVHWSGYFAVFVQREARRLFISKLYVLAELRGKGIGKLMLHHIIELASRHHLSHLSLTVNRNNPSVKTYLHWGFVNTGLIVKDIGGGFVMDDYQMEKAL